MAIINRREMMRQAQRALDTGRPREAVADLWSLLDRAHEVGIGDRVAGSPCRTALKHAVEQREQQHDDDPQGGVAIERVHRLLSAE